MPSVPGHNVPQTAQVENARYESRAVTLDVKAHAENYRGAVTHWIGTQLGSWRYALCPDGDRSDTTRSEGVLGSCRSVASRLESVHLLLNIVYMRAQ
jgi:hypothetical protein